LAPILGEETWNLIKDCACEVNKLLKIYCSLMNEVDRLGIILQRPTKTRKAVIMQVIFLLMMCLIEDLKLSGYGICLPFNYSSSGIYQFSYCTKKFRKCSNIGYFVLVHTEFCVY